MQKPNPVVLVVDRESDATRDLVAFLGENQLDVRWCREGESAFDLLSREAVDGLVAELEAEGIDGLALLERARERNPEVCAVVITGSPGAERALDALRGGAYDFQARPLHFGKLLLVLRRGLSHQALAARVAEMEGQLDERFGFESLSGHSRSIARVIEQLRHIASNATVLIEGETGTGKGRVAQAIHRNSPRQAGRFVSVDVGALAEGEAESELFGHEGGVLTGAGAPRRGSFEIADGGTLFLDEIGSAPPAVQVKLLRAIQDRTFQRVGGTETRKSDVRLVAATPRDLAADVKSGRFREDLYYRLSVVKVQMPPLRERREDIPLLTEGFLRELNREHGRRVTGITRGVLERLTGYSWPGNVRELKNAIEGMVVFAEGRRPLDLSDLPPWLREIETRSLRLELAVGMTVEEAERQLIAATLQETGQDKPRAAAMLGIGLRTLYRKIKQYGIH